MKSLYHYTNLNSLALILSSKKIKFNRLDKVNDPTEGETEDVGNFSKYIFISCWTKNREENLALWNMYTPNMRGVRIEVAMPIFNNFSVHKYKNNLVCENDILDANRKIFIYGADNKPLEVKYTNDQRDLIPKIRTEKGLATSKLGKYKRKIWIVENEVRYLLHIVPYDPDIKSMSIEENFKYHIDQGIPPSVECYYLNIEDKSFKNMVITLSPKMLFGDREIVEALINKYNKDVTIKESSLSGYIR